MTILALVATGAGSAQEPPLGDVARREQARREQGRGSSQTGAKTYTNEDLEALRGSSLRGNLNVLEAPSDGVSSPEAREGVPDENPSSASRGNDDGGDRGASLRAAMESADKRLQAAREQAESLRQQLSPMAQPYVQDVNERLRLQAELTAAETAMAQAERDLAQARQEYRELQGATSRQRARPGWDSPAS